MITAQKYYSSMKYLRFAAIVAAGLFVVIKSHAYVDLIEPGLAFENAAREYEQRMKKGEDICDFDRMLSEREMNELRRKERKERAEKE